MSCFARALPALVLALCPVAAHGEVFVRWDADHVPMRENLGISTLLVPANKTAAIQDALTKGYSVYLEVQEDEALSDTLPLDRIAGLVLSDSLTSEQITQLKDRLRTPFVRVLHAVTGGKWPHVRLNWVTKRNDVLQVSSRTAQPWLENNGALVRVAQTHRPDAVPLLMYPWTPITISDVHQGPALENYLVAIAEAGSFGSDLVLPLHASFQRSLLLGTPPARESWQEILRSLKFYAWDLPRHYRPLANIGFVTSDPRRHFTVLNLLTRHNLPFVLIGPEQLSAEATADLELLIALEDAAASNVALLSDIAKAGKTVVLTSGTGERPWRVSAPLQETEAHVSYGFGEGRVVELRKPVIDPNAFAMQIREVLGRDRRLIDIWNGITVLTALYEDSDRETVLLSLVNYAHERLPVQLRVRGTFAMAHFETPGQQPVLLSLQHRDGYTEFVLPALRIGGRVFLTNAVGFQ